MTACWREWRKSKTLVSACVACVDLNGQSLAQTQVQAGKALLRLSFVVVGVCYIVLFLCCLWSCLVWLSSAGRSCLLVDCDRFLVLLCGDVGICFFCILLEIKKGSNFL